MNLFGKSTGRKKKKKKSSGIDVLNFGVDKSKKAKKK